ncbi:MAG: PEP-CTERM sorting domain-containing protein, partial [Akkermansiaceae bacterium]|nr:PEP-CTERM sorting domain-containing protein [Akkermansiaceae bacterium]
SSFAGLDANGSWTLYIADSAAGDAMTLQGWSIRVTGVPEPSVGILMVGAALCLMRRQRAQPAFR